MFSLLAFIAENMAIIIQIQNLLAEINLTFHYFFYSFHIALRNLYILTGRNKFTFGGQIHAVIRFPVIIQLINQCFRIG